MPIRLICSDIDGTLLQYGRKELEGSAHRTTRKTVALSVPGTCFKGISPRSDCRKKPRREENINGSQKTGTADF